MCDERVRIILAHRIGRGKRGRKVEKEGKRGRERERERERGRER
jgi:hypothetical protein